MANARGRPPEYETPEEMQVAIDEYFDNLCDTKPTITGMVYSLGFCERTALDYYLKEKPAFCHTIKRAKMRIEEFLETELLRPAGVTGLIFNLKNNFGWKDEQKFEHTGKDGGPMDISIKWVE
jgi:hypothetical protein